MWATVATEPILPCTSTPFPQRPLLGDLVLHPDGGATVPAFNALQTSVTDPRVQCGYYNNCTSGAAPVLPFPTFMNWRQCDAGPSSAPIPAGGDCLFFQFR